MNRKIVVKEKRLLIDATLGKQFWAEAVNTTVDLHNRCVDTGLNDKTPFEAWYDRKPNVSHLRIIGSELMVHIKKNQVR